ncbi:UNVERIFIED_CONTAM: hypothetical protein PYX00_001614 [Menopon gallinae]|uniref:Uncharacterized protein n=1 Tax=Menopon gallinae TaxID=328185 RepID=A0AAW2IEP4_9NEOP
MGAPVAPDKPPSPVVIVQRAPHLLPGRADRKMSIPEVRVLGDSVVDGQTKRWSVEHSRVDHRKSAHESFEDEVEADPEVGQRKGSSASVRDGKTGYAGQSAEWCCRKGSTLSARF